MTFRSLCAGALGAVLALSISLGGSGAVAQAAPESVSYVPSEVLVGVEESADTAGTRLRIESIAGTVLRKQARIKTYRVKLKKGLSVEQAIAELKEAPGIAYAEPNYTRRAFSAPNDTYYLSHQYGPQKVQADLAWEVWNPQAPTVIAIIDTGVQLNHPELAAKMVGGYDFINNDADATDDNGHGTHVAGIAAAQVNNGAGIAGIAGWNGNASGSDSTYTKIMPVKVLAADGSGDDAGVADGIIYAADNGAKVINLSLGAPESSATLQNAVDYAYGKGCVVIAAAGNSYSSALSYPAACTNVLSVAATNSTDTLSDFSSYGSWVNVAAPGQGIASTYIGSAYATTSGTSMACPLVAGEAALIRSQNPNLTNAQVREIIVGNTDALTPSPGRTIGGGRVNVFRALKAATLLGGNPAATSAAFVKVDTTTQGNWKGVYGSEGYRIPYAESLIPAFARMSDSGASLYPWSWATADTRALLYASSSTSRIASCWYSGSSFDLNVELTDDTAHQVALYLVDYDRYGRSQRVEVIDADTGVVLDSRNVSGFQQGQYLVWSVTGNVKFRVSNNGGNNAVVSGLFIDGTAQAPPPPPPPSAAASFVRTDTTTQGSWKGVYGSAGYRIAYAETLTPAFAQVSESGANLYPWSWATSDVRALSYANSTARIASCWYSGSSFDFNVNLTDSQAHQVALYLVDYDGVGRQQRVDVLDVQTGAVLDSRSVSGFQQGQYLVWNVTGNVKFRVTNTGGTNAVASGLFID